MSVRLPLSRTSDFLKAIETQRFRCCVTSLKRHRAFEQRSATLSIHCDHRVGKKCRDRQEIRETEAVRVYALPLNEEQIIYPLIKRTRKIFLAIKMPWWQWCTIGGPIILGEFEIIPILSYLSLTDPWFPHKTGGSSRLTDF